MQRILIMTIISIILSSCGSDGGSGGGGDGSNIRPQIMTVTPIFLEKDYPNCPLIYEQSTNTNLDIIKFF